MTTRSVDGAQPSRGPLQGIRVVELASFMAVPFGTMILELVDARVDDTIRP